MKKDSLKILCTTVTITSRSLGRHRLHHSKYNDYQEDTKLVVCLPDIRQIQLPLSLKFCLRAGVTYWAPEMHKEM